MVLRVERHFAIRFSDAELEELRAVQLLLSSVERPLHLSLYAELLGMFADIIREHLGISADYKPLFGISFGYPDETSPVNGFRMGRDPLATNVTFY